ncbi:MAG: hypothetical protein ABWZ99_16285, partial [Ilumatobacteraceae bacterium]
MNEQPSPVPPSRRRRRASAAIASVALLGASMTACSSGGRDADAAATTDDTAATTDDTVVADADGGPQFSLEDGAPGVGGGPGGLGGEVTAIDGSRITVENQGRDGTTTELTVETTDDTTVTATTEGTVDDLAVGDTIVAIGEAGDDRFVASMITEGAGVMGGPVFQGGPGGPGGDGQPPVFVDGELPDGSIPAPPEGGQGGFPEGGPTDAPRGQMAGQLVTGTITEIGESTVTVESADGVETVVEVGDDT